MNVVSTLEGSWKYAGWRVVFVASLAMVATLPGRTVGLGLITEPLLTDLQITRVHYSNLTIWATILGALFSPICGKAIDRWGVRVCLSFAVIPVAVITITMSIYVAAANLLLFLILSRGFGQSSLSTASVTAVGKWFDTHLGIALGIFSALVALGFATAIPLVGGLIDQQNWRSCWFGIGIALIAVSAFAFTVIPAKGKEISKSHSDEESVGWLDAIRTSTFWTFTVSVALYYLILSGLTLFCESVLEELGFGRSVYIAAMISMMGAGLVGNFLIGWLSSHWKTNRLLAGSLLILAVVMLGLPQLQSTGQVVLLFALFGICGGAFAVLFFVGYGKAFGPKHLGRVQGIAQAVGVVASALGPKLLAETQMATGSYWLAFRWLGFVAIIFAIVAWCTPMFRRAGIGLSTTDK